MADVDAGTGAPPPEPERPWWRAPVGGPALALIAVLALAPAVRIAIAIRRAPRLGFADYWPMLDSVLRKGGGLDLGELFRLRNEHPVAVAKLVFWANARVLDGSNRSLAAFVIVLGILQVVVVAVAAGRTGRSTPWAWAGLVVAGGSLVFARQGLWHFYKSMSGTAWLTADLFVLLALTLNQLRRTGLSIVAAGLAAFSYGTGLMVWPALIVATILRDRSARRAWPYLVLGLVDLAWYVPTYRSVDPEGTRPPSVGIIVKSSVRIIGAFFTGRNDDAAFLIGIAVVGAGFLLGVVLLVRCLQGRDGRGGGVWAGLLLYAIGGAAMASGAKYGLFVELAASRYAAIGALATLGVLGMLMAVLDTERGPTRFVVPGVAAVVVLAVSLGGGHRQAQMESELATQDVLATAMHLRLADGSSIGFGGFDTIPVGTEARLRSVGDVPFDGSYDLDCGRLGSTLTDDERGTTAADGQVVDVTPGSLVPHGTTVVGWLDPGDRVVDCVVLATGAGEVVGAAGTGSVERGYAGLVADPPDHPLWFLGLAPDGPDVRAYVRYEGDSRYEPIPGP